MTSPKSLPSVLLFVTVVATALLSHTATSFIVSTKSRPIPALQAAKKSSRAKGFGKVEPTTPNKSSPKPSAPLTERSSAQPPVQQKDDEPSKPFLQSVDNNNNDSSDPEERAKSLLREKYGMKTLGEQQLDAKQLELRKEQQKKLSEWKAKAERGEDFDIMSILPGPVLIAIDRFLKLGTALCTVAFISAGILITLEAGSKALESPLPENLDEFIVNIVEPNFTPGLFVLLGFSVSLGAFAALQLGSQGSTYKEQ